MNARLDLAAIDADLAEVRANVNHGEALHNPHALTALRAAESLRAELERARTVIRSVARRLHDEAETTDMALHDVLVQAARDLYAAVDGAR